MNAQSAVIGLDAGTSVTKAVAFDLEGNKLYAADARNERLTPSDLTVEQDMDATWTITASILRHLADRLADDGISPVALGVTGQGDGTWLVDGSGVPCAPARLWLDGRAGDEVVALNGTERERRYFEITGSVPNPAIQNVQLMAWRKTDPMLLQRAETAFHCKDWLYFKLTGERATDPSEAVYAYGNFRTRTYDDQLIDLLELSDLRRLLPDIVDFNDHHGALQEDVTSSIGLPQGLPVVLGPIDVLCSGVAGGLLEPGQKTACTILGSSGIHMILLDSAAQAYPRPMSGEVMLFPDKKGLVGILANMAATLNIDWFIDLHRDLITQITGSDPGRETLLRCLESGAEQRSPGGCLYNPFLYETGERAPFVDPYARAQFLGMTQRVNLFDLYRAIYEGIGFAARDCYEVLGAKVSEIRLTGGAARSKLMRRIIGAATNSRIRLVTQPESGAAGAAMCGLVSIGAAKSFAELIPQWVHPHLSDPADPDPTLTAAYQRLFPIYQEAYRVMPDLWASLHKTRQGVSVP